MAEISYLRLLAEFRKRDNFAAVFRAALENVAAKVDFSRVKSCLAFGTNSGEREMEFARRLLANLRSFTGVEPDPESASALRASFQKGLLPGVETLVVETSIQSWNGVGDHVDAVLLFNVLGHVDAKDREDLFQQLMRRYLSCGDLVVVCNDVCSVPSADVLLMERLGVQHVDYDKLEEEILDAGFRVVFKQDFEVRRDLSDPSDGVLKFVKMCAD